MRESRATGSASRSGHDRVGVFGCGLLVPLRSELRRNRKRRPVSASLSDVTGGTLLELGAKCVIMLLILIPNLTFAELNQALGGERLRQILFEQRAGSQSGRRRD